MADEQNPVLNAEPTKTENESEPNHQEPEKKGRFKFHLILMLILGVGTWAFITYAPIVKQWKTQWYEFTHQSRPQTYTEPVQQAIEEEVFEEEVEATPTFTSAPIIEETPELETVAPASDLTAESLADLSALVTHLQEQIATMQGNTQQIYHMQNEFSTQQVKAQVFSKLQQASSNHSSIEAAAAAWKSISLLPLIDENRRTQAEQAWQELAGLNNDMQILSNEVMSHLGALAEKLHPQALADVAENLDYLVDEYANADTFQSWLDWLQQQFKLSKVREHAVSLSDDPFADIKALMRKLDDLEKALRENQWQRLPDINALTHQLEQYGIETSLSAEAIQHMQQNKQAWQNEAKAWMEQL